MLAFSSVDSKISICNGMHSPRLLRRLEGHSDAITGGNHFKFIIYVDGMSFLDFCWSMMNDIIISTSADNSIRVWKVMNGECIRNLPDDSTPKCCCFHLTNNNIFFVGTSKGFIKAFNLR